MPPLMLCISLPIEAKHSLQAGWLRGHRKDVERSPVPPIELTQQHDVLEYVVQSGSVCQKNVQIQKKHTWGSWANQATVRILETTEP